MVAYTIVDKIIIQLDHVEYKKRSVRLAVHRLLTVHHLVRVSVNLRVKFKVRVRDMVKLKFMDHG